jgi:hypothetical protein
MMQKQNPFLGLLSLDFVYMLNIAILVIIYLALFTLLYEEKPVPILVGLTFGLIGVACYCVWAKIIP